jgi:GLPGLI family protein
MKHIFLFIISATFLINLSAQQTSGEIIYQETKDTKPDMQKAEEQGWAQWADMIPETMTFKKRLLFDQNSSMYVNVKQEVDDSENKMMKKMMRRYSNANNQTYRNSKTNTFVEQEDFMGKTFLIKGAPEKIKWKISGEMKVILNYPCLKASYSDSTETLEAWFTTEIQVAIGPEKYGQLPGMILELTSKKNKKTITATAIDLKEIDPTTLSEPIDGKEVTRKEYKIIVRKKKKEMRESGGRGGHGGKRH